MRMVKTLAVVLMSVFMLASLSYGEYASIDELITDYNKATDLQRSQILNQYKYGTLSVRGTVENVKEWDIFDERNQVKKRFYKVRLQPVSLDESNIYIISIFYKDKADADKINRNQKIDVDAVLLKINPQPGSFAIWVYHGQLSSEDKLMFADK